jgi:predicted hydrocarbon binding protein
LGRVYYQAAIETLYLKKIIAMTESNTFSVNTARDALSLLSQRMYALYGDNVLPEIESVWRKLGISVGKNMKMDITNIDLFTVSELFYDSVTKRGTNMDILELNNKRFHIRRYSCGLGLQGKGKKLCWACMGLDRGIFEEATGKHIRMDIINTLAEKDDCCEIIIEQCPS